MLHTRRLTSGPATHECAQIPRFTQCEITARPDNCAGGVRCTDRMPWLSISPSALIASSAHSLRSKCALCSEGPDYKGSRGQSRSGRTNFAHEALVAFWILGFAPILTDLVGWQIQQPGKLWIEVSSTVYDLLGCRSLGEKTQPWENAFDVTIRRDVDREIVADRYLESADEDVCRHSRDLWSDSFKFEKSVDQPCAGGAVGPDLLRSSLVLLCYASQSRVDVTAQLFV